MASTSNIKGFAICNEIYGDAAIDAASFADMAAAGYTGVEIAPFTLGSTIHNFAQAKAIANTARDQGLDVVGLHWLLAKTEGFHLTSPDKTIRQATIDYAKHLCDLCSAMGGDIMVWGSPQQRSFPETQSSDEAFKLAVDAMQPIGEYAEQCGATIAFEPLGPNETNFITSAAEGEAFADAVNQPAIKLHLDVKAMANEVHDGQRVGSDGTAIAENIRQHTKHFAHFHANDPNLKGPGQGDVDFKPIAQAIHDVAYTGWVSVEVFDFSIPPEQIARLGTDTLRQVFGLI